MKKNKERYFLYDFRTEEWLISEGSKADINAGLVEAIEEGESVDDYAILKEVPFEVDQIIKVTINGD